MSATHATDLPRSDIERALHTRNELRAFRRVRPRHTGGARGNEPLPARILGGLLKASFRLVAGFVGVLPLEVALELGAAIGTAAAWLLPGRRRVARENLAIAFPEKTPAERWRILRRSFANFGRTVVEFVRFGNTSPRTLVSLVERVDGHHVTDPAARGSGVLALSAHLGNFEMIAAYHNALRVIRCSLIGRKVKPQAVDDIVCGLRLAHGVETIPNKEAARDVIGRVANGEGIGVVLDQNMRRGHGVFVPFFGKLASTTPGLAVIARRTGAPVVPIFMQRQGVCGRHVLRVFPPLEWDEAGGDKKKALVVNTAHYTRVIEEAVRRNPEEWLWVHRRWRTQPTPNVTAKEENE